MKEKKEHSIRDKKGRRGPVLTVEITAEYGRWTDADRVRDAVREVLE